MFNVPKRYVPSFLTKKDKRKQSKELRRSRRAYKKGKYYTRKMPYLKHAKRTLT